MLSGGRAFHGESAADTMSAILKEDPPDLSATNQNVSPALERLVNHCLEKNPEERFHSASDLAFALEALSGSAPVSAQTMAMPAAADDRRSRFGLAMWIATAVAAVLAIVAAYFAHIALQPKPVMLSTLLPPEKTSITGVPALSPDGTKLAFIGMDEKGNSMLYVRPLNSSTVQALSGTQGAGFPFWSPDSDNLGFFADGKLKRMPANGGPAIALADLVGQPRGGTWSMGGVIIYASDLDRILKQVPADGGLVSAASKFTSTDGSKSGETGHMWPHFLPDGKHFLFWTTPGRTICVGQLGSLEHKALLDSASQAVYSDGQLLFVRDERLLAQPFSISKLATTGDPIPIADYVAANRTAGGSYVYSVSDTGLLVYVGGEFAAKWPLTWYSRDGKALGNVGEIANYARHFS
jgi:eukaryotic-like serine/threonine-protein kinase